MTHRDVHNSTALSWAHLSPAPTTPPSRIPHVSAALTGGIALLALAGWQLDLRLLAGQWSGYIPMAPSTALGFALLAGALTVVARRPSHHLARGLAWAAIGIVAFVALRVALDFLLGYYWHAKSAAPNPAQWSAAAVAGLMSPLTALLFLLEISALALLLLAPRPGRIPALAALLATITIIIGMVILGGYAYGVPFMYRGAVIPLAIPTACAFLSAGIGILWLAMPGSKTLQSWLGNSMRGHLLRAFLPATLLITFANGWVSAALQRQATFNPVLGQSLLAFAGCTLIVAVVAWTARRTGDALEQAQRALRSQTDNLTAIFGASPVGMLLLDENTVIVDANAKLAAMVLREPAEIINQRGGGGLGCIHSMQNKKGCGFAEACPGCPLRKAILGALSAGAAVHGAEIQATLLVQGREQRPWLRISAEPVCLNGRKHVIVAVDDITEQRQTRDALTRAHAELRLLLDSTAEAIIGIDAHGLCTFCNPASLRLLQYHRAEELLGQSLHTLVHHTDSNDQSFPGESCPMIQALQAGSDTHSDAVTFRRADGSTFPVELWSHPQMLAGRVVGAVVTFLDISERQHAAEKLRYSEERYRALFESSCDAIMTLGLPDGKFTSCNAATVEMFGARDNAEFLALGPWDVSPERQPDGRLSTDKAREMINTALTEGSHFFEWTHRRVRGAAFPATVLLTRMEHAGQVLLQATVRNIAAQKQAELEERQRRALEDSVKSMEHVIGVVAHELRTPLAGLRAISELLLDHNLRQTEDFDHFLGSINKETIRMADTVNGLLEAARINSGKAQWNWGEVALAEACEGALATVRPLVDPSQVALKLQVTPPDARMQGDYNAIQRLLVNLVGNARKYTHQGHIAIGVHLLDQDGAQWAQIQVQDTGVGIAPAIARRLGEAFALNSGMVGANHIKGTGLGMAICKAIVAVHGGTLTVQSVVGQGTTITVRLRADLSGALQGEGHIAFTGSNHDVELGAAI